MRLLITIVTFVLPLGLFSQPKAPIYFLNLEKIQFENNFILPNSISSINVKKDKDTGEVYILTKEIPWMYKSINDLITDSYENQYDEILSELSFTKIFYIDNHLINDPSIIKIDRSYYCDLTIFDLSKSKQLDEPCRKTMIINIKLTEDKPKRKIILRGDNLPEDETLN